MNDLSENQSPGYDPNKSQVSDQKLATFLEDELSEDLLTIPGIGQKTAVKLQEEGIQTTYQLIGQFLTFKGAGESSQAHCDKMWHWFREIGINQYRSGIIYCLVEKCEILMPGLY